MKEGRHKQIEQLVAARQSVTMQELCDTFCVSINTIRADVASLVRDGVVEKIYGGIRVKEQKEIPLYATRATARRAQKMLLAQAAAARIVDGDIIYIDAGTTAMHILEYLPSAISLTIVTPSLPVIRRATEMEHVNLVVLPGMYNRRTNALLDGSTAEYLARYQHTKAFMGVSSLAANGSLGVSSYLEYELKRTAVARSAQRFLLTDASKYGEAGLLSYGNIEQMDAILTTGDMPEEFLALCRERGTTLELL